MRAVLPLTLAALLLLVAPVHAGTDPATVAVDAHPNDAGQACTTDAVQGTTVLAFCVVSAGVAPNLHVEVGPQSLAGPWVSSDAQPNGSGQACSSDDVLGNTVLAFCVLSPVSPDWHVEVGPQSFAGPWVSVDAQPNGAGQTCTTDGLLGNTVVAFCVATGPLADLLQAHQEIGPF